jgi:protein involved in polysaccharide export with SLBB domain
MLRTGIDALARHPSRHERVTGYLSFSRRALWLLPAVAVVLTTAGCAAREAAAPPPDATAAAPPPDATAEAPPAERLATALIAQPEAKPEEYAVGPKDLLEVSLFDIEDANGDPQRVLARVSQGGTISAPLIGRVEVAGLSALQIEKLLKEHYRQFIYEPRIAVFVKEHRNRRVSATTLAR